MSMKRSTYNTIIIIICIFMSIFAYFNSRNKKQINEAKRLPFTNTSLENVSDGIYEGKTYTSFMHLVLNVTVKDHKLDTINIIENKGSKGQKANKIIEKMIEENKVVIPLIKGDELATLVFISCVDSAIKKGVAESGQIDLSE